MVKHETVQRLSKGLWLRWKWWHVSPLSRFKSTQLRLGLLTTNNEVKNELVMKCIVKAFHYMSVKLLV
jgi:hypothetical protein